MWQVGDVWTGRVEVRDTAGALADAGNVTATVTAPDGAETSLGIGHPSAGVYTAAWPLTLPGRYVIRWVASGANASAHTDVVDVADPTSAPLVSLSEVLRHLGLAAAVNATQRARDADLEALADGMTELVEGHCGRAFRPRQVVQVHADGGAAILLHTLPVASITSVVDTGTTLDASAYRLSDAGVLYRRSGVWGETTVTYVAGTSVPPEPVRLAVLRLIEHHWTSARQAPHPMRAGAGARYDETQPVPERFAIPYAIASLLEPYRVHGLS